MDITALISKVSKISWSNGTYPLRDGLLKPSNMRITAEEKRLKEQKRYTDSHGGSEACLDSKGKYYCLKCGSYFCDKGSSKLSYPGCGIKFDWKKYIIMTPVL